jgi:hypothetical protein
VNKDIFIFINLITVNFYSPWKFKNITF